MKYLINKMIGKSNISVNASMIFFVCLPTVYIKSAQADFIVRDGFTPLGTDSINIQTGTSFNNSWVYTTGAPSYFGIYLGSLTSTSSGCSEAGVQRLTSMDGYSGIEITPNILLVIYNSTLSSTAQKVQYGIDYGIETQKATFDAKGNLSVNTGTQMSGKICYDVRNSPPGEQLNLTNVRSTIGDLQWGIYVKPGTPTAELKVSNILIGKINTNSNWATQALSLSGQTLKINPPVKCVINPPPATVRASMLNITAPCGSSTASGAVYFSTSTSGDGDFTHIEKLNPGTNTIPYRFSHCALPDIDINQFGSASAQATINLDWD